jgi:hypothetical protein
VEDKNHVDRLAVLVGAAVAGSKRKAIKRCRADVHGMAFSVLINFIDRPVGCQYRRHKFSLNSVLFFAKLVILNIAAWNRRSSSSSRGDERNYFPPICGRLTECANILLTADRTVEYIHFAGSASAINNLVVDI